MKHLLYALLPLPGRLLAQVNGATVPPAPPTRDTTAAADWTLNFEVNQRTFYLGREYGGHAFSLAYTLTGHYIILRRTPDDTAASLPTGTYLSAQVDFSF